jgi:hypothetical protein
MRITDIFVTICRGYRVFASQKGVRIAPTLSSTEQWPHEVAWNLGLGNCQMDFYIGVIQFIVGGADFDSSLAPAVCAKMVLSI